MRIVLVLFLGTLALAGCKRETQEAVAQAKGAAADAERAAKDAAAQARNAADQAASSARSAADQAKAAADEAAAKARGAAGAATESARRGLDNASQTVHELGAGDQVQGVIVSAGRTELDVRPADGPVRTLTTDDETRWIRQGSAAGRDGFPIGSSVRVTYIVKHGQQLATRVEALGR
jgi:Flp pilus assembly protein TadG